MRNLEDNVTRKRKRNYTKEFKEEAVNLYFQGDKGITQVAKDIGIPHNTLFQWVKAAEKSSTGPGNGSLTHDEREELKRLRKGNKQIKMERDFLKKVSVFFAREENK